MEEQISSHISDLEGLNSELEGFLSELQGREEGLSSRIKALEEELSSVRMSAAMEKESLSNRLRSVDEVLAEAKSALADKEKLIKDLRAAAKEDAASLNSALEAARVALSKESAKLSAAILDRDDLERRLQASGELLEEVKASLGEKDELLKETRAAAKEKAAELSAAIDQARAAQEAEADRVGESEKERAALLSQLEASAKLLESEKARSAEKEQLLLAGRAALKAKEDDIDKLLRSMEELKADLALERSSVKDRETQLQKAARLREGLEKKLDLAAQENSRSEEGFLLKIELVKKELREQAKRAEDLERKLAAAGSRLEDALEDASRNEKLLSEAGAALAEKESQLRDANQKLTELTKEFTQIKSGSTHESASKAREAAAAMAARVEELENTLSDASSRHMEKFRAVQAELSAVKADLRAREEENTALHAREETLSRELGDAEEKWKFASAQLHNAASKFRNAENEMEIAQGRIKSLEEERDKFRAAVIKAEAASAALASKESKARDGEAAGLMAALEEQAARNTELLRKYDDLVLQNEAAAHEKAALNAEIESLRAALRSAQDSADAQTGEKLGVQAGLAEKLRMLEADLKRKEYELAEANSSAEAAAREAGELRLLLEEKEDSAAGEAEAERARYAALSERMHNTENLLKKKEFELEEAREALSGLEGECAMLRRSRAELGEKYSREIQAENEQLKEAQARIEERDARISRLASAEESLKHEAERLKRDKQGLLSMVRKKAGGAAHSAKVSEAERLLADKEGQLEKLRAELENTRAEKAQLQGREKELREELKARPYRAMLREAEEKLLIKEKMLSDVTFRMKRITHDFEELKVRGQSSGAPGYLPDFEELVAGVAHQIANSISIIRSHAEFCAEAPDAEGSRESLDVIVRNIVNLQKKIDLIMNFSKPVIPQRSPERLAAVVAEVVESLRSAGRFGRAKVKLKGGERLRPVSIDRVRFAAAAEQLLLNAAEAMPGGGEIHVTISGGGGRQRLEVADKGAGIEKKNLGSVFHPFFTTRHGKMGLGLTLARNVARAHGGSLDLHSEPGKGTRAVMELPEIS
ncbi:MAG: ATP-binding protein [Elusimicrobia bacterium]|nr:ATP-binding protein [Elusimicrobiota bacterium]